MGKWKADESKFLVKSKKLDKIDLTKLSDTQLEGLFIDYIETYFKAVSSSSLIDGFALGTDETIQKEINAFERQKSFRGTAPLFHYSHSAGESIVHQ